MELKETIEKRRAYRSLEYVEITDDLIQELAEAARLAPSCFNNQPWRFIFVFDKEVLKQMREALSKGNEWVYKASLIIVVFSRKDFDCDIKGREYYLFDTGLATAFIILRATELDLVAHPIAGYNESKVKEILRIPDDMKIITLVNVGKHAKKIDSTLSEKQVEWEANRPERLPLDKLIYRNRYGAD